MSIPAWPRAALPLTSGSALVLILLAAAASPLLAQDLEMLDGPVPAEESSAEPETAPAIRDKSEPADDPSEVRRGPAVQDDPDPAAELAEESEAEAEDGATEAAESLSVYEAWEPGKASDLLPDDLLSGPHHRVAETVGSFGYQHRYRIESDFGEFRVAGDSMLRRLVRELAAIATLRAALQAEGLAEGANGVAPADLWEDPVATVTGVPDGPFEIIRRGSGRLVPEGENGTVIPLAAVQEIKRDLAYRLSVDVYSSNEVLQRALNRAAWSVVVGGQELALDGLRPDGGERLVAQMLRDIGPEELRRDNRRALALMGFPEPLIDRFLDHRLYSPRHRTVMVQALVALPEVAGRRRLIEAALATASESGALFYQQVAETLAAIQAEPPAALGKLVELVEFGGLILAYGDAGGGVVPLPLDRARWTGPFASLMRHLAEAHPRAGQETRLEVWVSGTLSDRARTELETLGFAVLESVAERVALVD